MAPRLSPSPARPARRLGRMSLPGSPACDEMTEAPAGGLPELPVQGPIGGQRGLLSRLGRPGQLSDPRALAASVARADEDRQEPRA